MSIVGVIASDPGGTLPTDTLSPSQGAGGKSGESKDPDESAAAPQPGATPLVIKVLRPTTVFVQSGTGDDVQVLQSGALSPGDVRQYDQVPLNVAVSDGSAVEVTIYGNVQPKSAAGQRKQWLVKAP